MGSRISSRAYGVRRRLGGRHRGAGRDRTRSRCGPGPPSRTRVPARASSSHSRRGDCLRHRARWSGRQLDGWRASSLARSRCSMAVRGRRPPWPRRRPATSMTYQMFHGAAGCLAWRSGRRSSRRSAADCASSMSWPATDRASACNRSRSPVRMSTKLPKGSVDVVVLTMDRRAWPRSGPVRRLSTIWPPSPGLRAVAHLLGFRGDFRLAPRPRWTTVRRFRDPAGLGIRGSVRVQTPTSSGTSRSSRSNGRARESSASRRVRWASVGPGHRSCCHDIVDSTGTLERIGDAAWRDLLHEHNRRMRDQLNGFRGREVDTTGDGFLVFDSVSRAVQCGLAMVESAPRVIGISIRAGLHTGEVEFVGGNARGVAVHTAAACWRFAAADEVLVSVTTRDSLEGSGLAIEEAGPTSSRVRPGRARCTGSRRRERAAGDLAHHVAADSTWLWRTARSGRTTPWPSRSGRSIFSGKIDLGSIRDSAKFRYLRPLSHGRNAPRTDATWRSTAARPRHPA